MIIIARKKQSVDFDEELEKDELLNSTEVIVTDKYRLKVDKRGVILLEKGITPIYEKDDDGKLTRTGDKEGYMPVCYPVNVAAALKLIARYEAIKEVGEVCTIHQFLSSINRHLESIDKQLQGL